MTQVQAVLGWDIGGVNTKVARLAPLADGSSFQSISLPYELQREPSRLAATLRSAGSQIGAGEEDLHAVTMTAELSQAFRTKREGVAFVIDALESSYSTDRLHLYTVDGKFVTPRQARLRPLDVAASNWAATAHWVAELIPTCILIDVGTTTSDLIPIRDGKVAATGRTDPERLLTGELVYTGALRTPAEAMAPEVPLWGGIARVSAERFALSGDVHLWLGRLKREEYTCPTPDARPADREHAGERLARMVCADRDLLDDPAVDAIAMALARAQLQTIVGALGTIRRRCPGIGSAVVTGLGEFIAAEAARAAGLSVIALADRLNGARQTAPAAAVAWLLRESLAFHS